MTIISITLMTRLSGHVCSRRYFRVNELSGLLNRLLVDLWKSVSALFVQTSEISGLSEPGLTNHHCILQLLVQVISFRDFLTFFSGTNNICVLIYSFCIYPYNEIHLHVLCSFLRECYTVQREVTLIRHFGSKTKTDLIWLLQLI